MPIKCPHCKVVFDRPKQSSDHPVATTQEGFWWAVTRVCPTCEKFVHFVQLYTDQNRTHLKLEQCVWPEGKVETCPAEVDDASIRDDFLEAAKVLPYSAKASAALSRRCLQNILREKAEIKAGNLAKEIDQVTEAGSTPSHISESLDYVRIIGNFAAHPTKSKSSGEIVDVKSGEAEWNLEVVKMLLDFYFVAPARARKKRAELDAKLEEAGKPPAK